MKREGQDHYNLKKQICSYLSDNGWKADTEVTIKLFKKHNSKDVSNIDITVDVLAWKHGRLYIAEIGSLSSQDRKINLEEIADVFDHLSLDRKEYREITKKKWRGVDSLKFVVPESEPFSGETWRVTREIPYY